MHRVITIFVYIVFIGVLSCVKTNNKNEKVHYIIGSVDAIKIDHVIEKREGCRFSKVLILIEVENIDSIRRKIMFTPRPDHCESQVDTTNTYWFVWKKKIPLVTDNLNDTLVELQPNEDRCILFRAMYNFFGGSLRDRVMLYSPWFDDTFKVVYRHGGKEYIFRKSKDFEIQLFLDDTLVSPNDSIRYNKSIPGPPELEKDTLFKPRYIDDEVYIKMREFIWNMDW